MNSFSLTVHASDGAARAGTITTAHGEIPTPVFMPVGTAGTERMKAAYQHAVESGYRFYSYGDSSLLERT